MEMAHNKTIIKTHQKWLLVAKQQQTMLTIKQCRELLQEEEKELILKICDIKNITIDEIEEYFEEQESLKTR